MADIECVFDFGELKSEELEKHLKDNCQSLMGSKDCIIDNKELYEKDIIPIIENPTLIEKLNDLASQKKLGDTGEFDNTQLKVVKGLYSTVKPEAIDLKSYYASYLGFYKKADANEDAAAEAIAKGQVPGKTGTGVADIEGNSKYKRATAALKTLAKNCETAISLTADGTLTDFSEEEIEFLKQIQTASKEARKKNWTAKTCAKKLRDIEKEHQRIAGKNIGLAVTARGEYADLADDPKARADAGAALAAQSAAGDAGSGIIALALPKNFREQCLFLAQIFQFAEYHRDIQLGDESATTDAADVAARAKKKAQAGGSSAQMAIEKQLPYVGANENGNSSVVVEGEAFGFINKLTQYGSMINYFEATNAELAHLQPMIRLFKVTPASGKKEQQFEFPFDTFASKKDVKNIMSSKAKRGFGAGIQKFNFTFHGSNPFAIKKSIKASLQIRANNFSELLEPRGNGLRYIDLALKTGTAIEEKYDKSDLNFRIKAVVGLSVPNGETIKSYSIQKGVRNNFTTLNLTPVTHAFDFDDTGAVTFTIEYLAYVEEYFDKARMNIFADPEVSKRVIQRKLAVLTQQKNCQDEAEVKKLNEFIKEDSARVKEDKIKSLQFLSNQLFANDMIYYLNLSREKFVDLIQNGPFFNIGDIRENISLSDGNTNAATVAKELDDKFNQNYANQEGAKDKKSLQNSFSISGIENKNYAFFYLGDLIDLILKKIPQNLEALQSLPETYLGLTIDEENLKKEQKIISNSIEQFKKFRILLGPLEIVDHNDRSKSKEISFADLPISLSYFNEWLTSKLLAKDEASYNLTSFMNDLMNDFVTNFLNDDTCYNFNIKQRARVFQNVITSYSKDSKNDKITTYLSKNKLSRLNLKNNKIARPILETAGYREFDIPTKLPDKEFHFFVFYAGRVQPKDLMKGEKSTDQSNGIFHYILGRDKGIVKTIKLDKTDSPASLKMVRFEQEGYDGLRQLREIYDVNIATFANVQTYPGAYIYVEPRGFSPSLGSYDSDKFDLTDLGIGGYYMIIESTHEFAPGVMNTNIKAKWVQSLDNEDGKLQKVANSSIGDGSPTFKKCSVRS